MRTLLVYPDFRAKDDHEYQRYFSLGLPYVSSALKRAGFEVDCLNLTYCQNPYESLSLMMAQRQYDILGTTGLSAEFVFVRKLIQKVKEAHPEIRVVLGGGMITSQPELIMKLLPIDFGILGEGEETAVELWEALRSGKDVQKIAGLVYRDVSGGVAFTGRRPEIAEIGTIAWPDYDGFNLAQYISAQKYRKPYLFNYHRDDVRTVHMIASRSCPFSCTFCFRPLGRTYRQRPLDDFFAELEMLVSRYDINTLHLLDDLLTYNRDRLMEFCRRIKTFKISWASQARGDGGLDEESARSMRDSGCIHFAFGIESASQKILDSLNKKEQFWKIERSLKIVRNAGIPTGGNFIFGDAEEDWETATSTMNWWKNHQEYFIDLLYITCYPGSELYKKAVETGKITDEALFLEQGCPLVNISKMTDEEYWRWNYELERYKSKYRVFAMGVEFRQGTQEKAGRFYDMTVRCPKCGRSIVYGNMYKENQCMDDFVSVCRNCGQYFVVEDPDGGTQIARIAEQLHSFEPKVNTRRVAYFGAGVLASKMLRQERNPLRPVCIFDNDVRKQGQTLEGVLIAPFTGDSAYLRDLETIVITAPSYKDEIIPQIMSRTGENVRLLVAEYKQPAGYSLSFVERRTSQNASDHRQLPVDEPVICRMDP
jgi:anaerobic magnesium-protoporphyrin IX monomethyl ester cyclase